MSKIRHVQERVYRAIRGLRGDSGGLNTIEKVLIVGTASTLLAAVLSTEGPWRHHTCIGAGIVPKTVDAFVSIFSGKHAVRP